MDGQLATLDDLLPGMADSQPIDTDYREVTDDDTQQRIRAMVSDARDYNDSVLAPARQTADLYYMGAEPAQVEEGRSSIVATEVKDVIMGMMPSLMRIFTSSEPVCNFVAVNEKSVAQARQATQYINYKFMQHCDGFRVLSSVIMDALRKKVGAVQWYTDDQVEVSVRDYGSVSVQQLQMLLSEVPNAQVVHHSPSADMPGTLDCTIKFSVQAPKLRVEAFPPEELRIDRLAKSTQTAQLLGRERVMRGAELVAMGYDRGLVERHSGSGDSSVFSFEAMFRNPGAFMGPYTADPDESMVTYGEYYILIDTDGDGIEELNYICTMGDNDEVVKMEPTARRRIALFSPDLEPHTAIGHSIAEYCYDLQRIKTNLMRNSLDSLAQTIFPRHVINEMVVNLDDVLNAELGAPIRTKGDPGTSVQQLQTEFRGDQVLPIIGYLDQVRQMRTGVSEASKGVDPRALQSTTVKGVDMLISGAQERTELVARNLAHTGMREMFSGMLAEVTDHPYVKEIMFVSDTYVPVDPSEFSPSLPVMVNPNIGKGTDADRMLMLTQIKATQEMIIDKMGPENPLVSPVEYRNTIADLLKIANISEVSRYFKNITEQQVADAMKAKQQQQLSQPNPQLILANTEYEKVRSQTVKSVADNAFRTRKLELDDAFRHQQLQATMETSLINAMGQYGVQLNHDMAKHVITTAKELQIADDDREAGESGDGGESSGASSDAGGAG